MRAALVALLACALLPAIAQASPRIRYQLDLSARADGVVAVTVEIDQAPAPLTLVFPAWLPGAYELRYFGREVGRLEAETKGRALAVRRDGDTRFVARGHRRGARVVLRYEINAALFSDDGAELSLAHAYLNPGAVLPLVRGLERAEHLMTLTGLPKDWRVLAALPGDPLGGLVAPTYASLIDGPIEAAAKDALSVSTRLLGGAQFTLVLHDDAGERAPALPPSLWADLERMVEAEQRIAGTLPYTRYLVLIHLSERPERAVALEHAASTSVLAPHAWLEGEGYLQLRHMIAHELFHAWNARRLVPLAYATGDPERAQRSPELWFTEGLTEHAALVAQAEAGLRSDAEVAQAISLSLTRARQAERSASSLEDLSRRAFFQEASDADDPDAYYAMGQLVSLALIAELLARTEGRVGLPELFSALLPAPGRAARLIDRARLGKILDGLVPKGGVALSSLLDRWVAAPFSLAALVPSLEAIGLRVAERSDERGEPLLTLAPDSRAGPLRARLLGLSRRGDGPR